MAGGADINISPRTLVLHLCSSPTATVGSPQRGCEDTQEDSHTPYCLVCGATLSVYSSWYVPASQLFDGRDLTLRLLAHHDVREGCTELVKPLGRRLVYSICTL